LENHACLPERGRIGIFNRSYYEEVLVARVHPEILQAQRLPTEVLADRNIWKRRYQSIVDHERHLHRNGTRIVKFFLHVSKDEQRKRFLARIDDERKNWKFSASRRRGTGPLEGLHARLRRLPRGDEHRSGPVVCGAGRRQSPTRGSSCRRWCSRQ
jgi:hypothetical protein